MSNDKQYGFFTENYEDGSSIETLEVGDGKALFTDIHYPEGSAIGFSYGLGEGIGITPEHLDGATTSHLGIKWQVRFDNVDSIDAMIETLGRVRAKLVNP